MARSLGMIMLCIFLVVYGLLMISNFQFELSKFVLGATAIAAGIFLAMGK